MRMRWPGEDRNLRALQQNPKDIPSADAFWSAFRERAARVQQDVPESKPVAPWLMPAFASALILLLVGGGALWYASTQVPASHAVTLEVLDLGDDVYSYRIWNDAAGGGTLLWLMDEDGIAEGGS